MKPTTLTRKKVTTTETEIEYVALEDFVVYRRTTTSTTSGSKKAPTVKVDEGITSKAGLKAYEGGAVAVAPYKKACLAFLGTPEFREYLRTKGWVAGDVYEEMQKLTNPYTRLMEGTASAVDLLVVNTSSNEVYDVEGAPVPVAVLFDYIYAKMDNVHFDLPKVLEILKKREDITFTCEGSYRWRGTGEVERIPAYNADKNRNRCLTFVWMPRPHEYRCVVTKAAEYGDAYPVANLQRAVYDLDILGLTAGGAMKKNPFKDWRS